jgi:hypothetical protein
MVFVVVSMVCPLAEQPPDLLRAEQATWHERFSLNVAAKCGFCFSGSSFRRSVLKKERDSEDFQSHGPSKQAGCLFSVR